MKNVKIALLALALGAGAAAAHEGHHHDAAEEGGVQSVSGELVDMACFLAHSGAGEKHAQCSLKCVSGGVPLGVLTKDGQLYLVVPDHADEKPYGEAKALAGKNAKLTGRVVNKGGVQGLIIRKAEKL